MSLQNLFGDLALDATLVTIDTAIDSIDGKTPALGQALAAAAVPVVLTAIQVTALTPPTAITGFATSAKQDTLLTELQLKADLTETQPVSLASVPTHGVTGTFYQATQPVSIATMPSTPVTNADLTTLAGAVSATHMQVDVLSMPAGGVGLTDAELRATAVPISVASIPSHAVTNAGTFAVQAVLGAETTKVIGTVTVSNPTANPETGLATSAKQLADGHSVALSATDNAVLDSIALSQTDSGQKTQIVEKPPTDATKTNGSLIIGYTGDKITTITETINSIQYQQTITWTGGKITGISEAVQL